MLKVQSHASSVLSLLDHEPAASKTDPKSQVRLIVSRILYSHLQDYTVAEGELSLSDSIHNVAIHMVIVAFAIQKLQESCDQ